MSAIKKQNKPSVSKTKILKLKFNKRHKITPLEVLVEGFWKVTQASLWNHKNFSLKEQNAFKALIAEHFIDSKDSKRHFKELIQRICLAKRYVNRRRGRYISKPIDWLNINYHNGLIGTAKWLEIVKEQRKEVPQYNEGITILANGILKYMNSPRSEVYHRYRKLLTAKNQSDLLQIFNNTIISLQYEI
jgi:hypothetical protein